MSYDQATKELICELCRQFFQLGWVTGTGGSISIRNGDSIYMTPSGVQKERIKPDEIFVLDREGKVISTPNEKPGFTPKLSDCSCLFMHAYKQRNAGAVLHSHGKYTNIITSMFEGKSEFRLSHQEMIKGIKGHGYRDELVIPIIENTAFEHELADSLGQAIAKYPNSYAVLVRRHGMYVWGDTWEQAKRHGECLHYLFEVVATMKRQKLDYTLPAVTVEPEADLISINHAPFHDTPLYTEIKGTDLEQSQRELVCELCRQFYMSGWVTGTGGSISIRHGEAIFMTPSGVQKERILPDELYVVDRNGKILSEPKAKPNFTPKLSDCSPLFLHAFQQRNAGAVLHSHAINCNIITSIFEGQNEFKVSHQEMIKALKGHGYYDNLIIPIIENTAHEHELADSLGQAIAKYPLANAVLVRRHGMYVWGDTWEQAKRHGEGLHYLFDICLSMRELGMDFSAAPVEAHSTSVTAAGSKRSADALTTAHSAETKRAKNGHPPNGHLYGHDTGHMDEEYVHVPGHKPYKVYLFDIEGTTTPITFVKDVLFPYASTAVNQFITSTWSEEETQKDVQDLYHQYMDIDKQDSHISTTFTSTIVCASTIDNMNKMSKEDQIVWLTDYVQYNIKHDRKISSLKQLQGHIWRKGYQAGTIKGALFPEIASTFRSIVHPSETGEVYRVAIYSSGSREAQRLMFQYSVEGDLTPYISCYFDTSIGHKRESKSYTEIALSLGVEHPSDILFLTDIIEEAQAAKAAGLHAVLSIRPGNAPITVTDHGFKELTTFERLH